MIDLSRHKDGLVLIKAVIFDFDGTLFHFLLDFKGMRDSVKEVVIAGGVPASQLDGAERIKDFVERMLSYANTNSWTESKTNAIMSRIESVMDHYEWESAQKNTPLDGAMQVLRSLKGMRLKIGLLTNNSRRSIVYLFEKYHFSKMFDTIVTRNDLENFNSLKPSPVGLNMILARLQLEPSKTVYVGDSVIDIKTALSVGATPIFVTTGFSTLKEIRDKYPNVTVMNHIGQLLAYVKENV
jgi:phosphoglycolate phosphatase